MDARDRKLLAASGAMSGGESAFPKVTKNSSVNLFLDLIPGFKCSLKKNKNTTLDLVTSTARMILFPELNSYLFIQLSKPESYELFLMCTLPTWPHPSPYPVLLVLHISL